MLGKPIQTRNDYYITLEVRSSFIIANEKRPNSRHNNAISNTHDIAVAF